MKFTPDTPVYKFPAKIQSSIKRRLIADYRQYDLPIDATGGGDIMPWSKATPRQRSFYLDMVMNDPRVQVYECGSPEIVAKWVNLANASVKKK